MDEITVNVYDTHAGKFAAQYASANMAVMHRLLLRYLPPSARILEIGCGTGRDAAFLADNGFDVVATDASAEMMAQWEKPAFTALMDATEMVAIQRGVERWSAPTAVKLRVPQVRTPKPAPVQRLFSFGEISSGEHFKTALPMVGNLAAGPLSAGFEAISLDDVEECDWIKVPAKFAKPGRFVIRIAGDSMEPRLHVGDYAIFEYHRTPRQSGQVVIVAEFAESEPGQVAVKRYKADAAAWIFTADNPNRTGIRLEKTSAPYPILGTYVTKLP